MKSYIYTPKYSLLILLTIWTLSCGTNTKEKSESKQKKELEQLVGDIMEVNDRSISEHGKMIDIKLKLVKVLNGQSDSSVIKEINDLLLRIQVADKEMMDWIRGYAEPVDDLPFETKKLYYYSQLVAIQSTEKKIDRCINDANKILEKYPPDKE